MVEKRSGMTSKELYRLMAKKYLWPVPFRRTALDRADVDDDDEDEEEEGEEWSVESDPVEEEDDRRLLRLSLEWPLKSMIPLKS
jgi:hypothetical protein